MCGLCAAADRPSIYTGFHANFGCPAGWLRYFFASVSIDLPPKIVPMVKLVPAATSRIAARPAVRGDDIQGSCVA